jgi:hypothetical protein
MIKLNGMFSVSRKIRSLVEIKKMIGNVIEYTIVHKDSIYVNGNSIMIQKNVFSAKKDFFTKLRSI